MIAALPGAQAGVAERFTGWPVNLPVFAGPLDLLLYLIQREEINIHDIPIAHITAQYLAYLARLEEVQPEAAGEFLVMAATLLEIKSRLLLPRPLQPAGDEAEDEDPRAALVQQLLEYKRFQEAAEDLQERLQARLCCFPREVEAAEPGLVLEDEVNGFDLYAALQRVLAQAEAARPGTVARQPITVKMKMAELLSRLTHAGGEGVLFSGLFSRPLWRLEVVVTFLAVLELMRLRRVLVRQRRAFGDIAIALREQ